MGVDGLPIDILIFAAIAAFLVFRLRNALGKRPPDDGAAGRPPRTAPLTGKDEKVVQLADRGEPEARPDRAFDAAGPDTALRTGLKMIKKVDRNFNADEFLAGARAAFEMIIEAFSVADMKGVRAWLSDEVADNFERAISDRKTRDEALDTTLIGINAADVLEARMSGSEAFLTIRFKSEQINVTRGARGEILDGDPDQVSEVVDIWTFTRDTRSRDPNWVLIETRTPN